MARLLAEIGLKEFRHRDAYDFGKIIVVTDTYLQYLITKARAGGVIDELIPGIGFFLILPIIMSDGRDIVLPGTQGPSTRNYSPTSRSPRGPSQGKAGVINNHRLELLERIRAEPHETVNEPVTQDIFIILQSDDQISGTSG